MIPVVKARGGSSKGAHGNKMTRKRKMYLDWGEDDVQDWEIKKHRVETDDVRDWAGLHKDLLEDVIGKLPITDCLSFGSVCKPWGTIASEFLVKCDRRVPCLVKRGQNEVTARSCFSVVGNSKFLMDMPEAYGKCICGSFEDWLLLGKLENFDLDMSLLNPFSGENIELPRIKATYFLPVISAVPSNEKCICMLIGDFAQVAFWVPGAAQWHKTKIIGCLGFLDALYYNGCFYILENNDKVVVINEKSIISMLDTGVEIQIQALRVKLPFSPVMESTRSYLVESRGKILLVCRCFYMGSSRWAETSAFRIYMLDLNKLVWLKLESLDNHILFVGSGCSKSFKVEDLGDSVANSVYFINQFRFFERNEWKIACESSPDEVIDDWGLFSFQKENHWPAVFRAKPKQWAGVWLSAPLGWCLKQKRH